MSEPLDPWQEYRRRWKLVLFAYIGYLALVFATAWAADRLIHTSAPAIVVGLGWMALLAVSGIRCQRFRCPRCGKVFNSKTWFERMDAPCCVHCGLPRYAPPGPDHPNPRLPNACLLGMRRAGAPRPPFRSQRSPRPPPTDKLRYWKTTHSLRH